MGWNLHLTSHHCSQAFQQPLWLQAGVQRALCSPSVEAKHHHVQLEVEGGWEGLEGSVLQYLTLAARNGNLGSVHLHHHLLFFHLNGAVPPFKSQRGCETNNVFLDIQAGAALDKYRTQIFRSLENLGETFWR